MAYTTLQFVNPHNGHRRRAPVGFSWTTLFFGFWPALLRGHWTVGLIQFVLALVTFGLSHLYFIFAYNGIYIRHLVRSGYVVSDDEGHTREVELRARVHLPRLSPAMRASSPSGGIEIVTRDIDGRSQAIRL